MKQRKALKRRLAAWRASPNRDNPFVPWGYYMNRPKLLLAKLAKGIGRYESFRFVESPR